MRAIIPSLLLVLSVPGSAQYQTNDLVAGIHAPMPERPRSMPLMNELDEVSASYLRALDMLDRGIDEAALVHLDRMLDLSPRDVGGLLHRGETLARMGRHDAARADLLEVLDLMPKGKAAERALYRLGLMGYFDGDVIAAHAYFDRLVIIAPGHALGTCERGIANAALYRDEEAAVDLALAVSLDPSMPHAHAHLGIVLLRLHRIEEACLAFQSALGLGDRSVEELLLVHCEE